MAIDNAGDQISALVVNDMGLHAKAGCGLGGVYMGKQTECGFVLGAFACGDVRDNVAVLGYTGIFSAECAQLVGQKIGKIKLAGG